MKRALVTGSHGFAGTHLRRLLGAEGWTVAGLDVVDAAPAAGETYHRADLTRPPRLREAVLAADPDVVFHLAGVRGTGPDVELARTVAINVHGVWNLIEALGERERPVRLVVVGSSAQYGAVPTAANPIDESVGPAAEGVYGWTKAAAEAVALACHGRGGLEVVAARPFNHSGPGEPDTLVASAFARQIAAIEAGAEPVLHVGNLESVRDLADVRDIVRGYLALAERGTGGRIYNLCSGRGVRIAEILRMLLDMTDTRIEVRPDPDRQRPSDLPVQVGSHARATEELGWSPEIPLATTLRDLLADWRERLGGPSPKGSRS